jgi:site-specific DNA-methyltransferase (adenine-specific)/modification methylase
MRPVTIKLPEELLLDAQVEADLSQTTLSTLVRDGLARRLEETALARATKRRERARKALALRPPLAPVQMGGDCTLYCGDALQLVPHLPRQAAVVSDPPYPNHYDYTKTRRRDARWTENFPGMDQPFDPTPWLQFPEVILMGADHYWVPQMERGAVWFWHKMPGQDPGDQSPCEIIWLSTPGPPAVIPHKWRGGMREGEENWVHLHDKLHPAQKPIAVMTYLVQHTAAPVVIGVCSGYV